MFAIIPATILLGGLLIGAFDANANTLASNSSSYYQIVDGSCYDSGDAEHMKANSGCDTSSVTLDKSPSYQVIDGSCYDSGDAEHMSANTNCDLAGAIASNK